MLNYKTANTTYEDDYALFRAATGTTLRSKDKDLSYDQVRQKLQAAGLQANYANEYALKAAEYWIVTGCYTPNTSTKQNCITYWIRRTI